MGANHKRVSPVISQVDIFSMKDMMAEANPPVVELENVFAIPNSLPTSQDR